MQPTLDTARLTLRPFQLSDAKRVQELAGNIEVARTTLGIPHPYPIEAAESWIEAAWQFAERGERYAWAMAEKENDTLLGCMSIGVTKAHQRAELAYWVGRPYWGQGYATEAAKRVVAFGFEELALNRIFAAAMSKNPGSYTVMIKLGMKKEGEMKQHLLKWETFEDLVYYGLLRSDYEAARGEGV
ncbi:RimJ/RimL family protein N-acetyltransferase [Paenibacillus phyllosphaerae]|uniref:RimJ/RimL family protein N-acetyltransferase n=2 Tax=Paenibacillus phyllosphaerae TaxID=274593 RepID=A0A7W5FPZ8_9BACL|nr:GNAT family N-acetyltransferase [Paenibacillus phyllosphaerae]MBB3112768.1 RimJ/RimL family protein N-acetyltransferase [Paenibacillus phyllosphaerae]